MRDLYSDLYLRSNINTKWQKFSLREASVRKLREYDLNKMKRKAWILLILQNIPFEF